MTDEEKTIVGDIFKAISEKEECIECKKMLMDAYYAFELGMNFPVNYCDDCTEKQLLAVKRCIEYLKGEEND